MQWLIYGQRHGENASSGQIYIQLKLETAYSCIWFVVSSVIAALWHHLGMLLLRQLQQLQKRCSSFKNIISKLIGDYIYDFMRKNRECNPKPGDLQEVMWLMGVKKMPTHNSMLENL